MQCGSDQRTERPIVAAFNNTLYILSNKAILPKHSVCLHSRKH